MKFKTAIAASFAVALSCVQAFGQATILPPGQTCFQANVGTNGMLGLLGTITGGSSYTNGTYGGVSLTGGSGSNATANITVSGNVVTAVAVLNPGIQYVVGDVLSASIAGGSGFSVPVASVAINSSLAGGSVGFFIPNTSTVKQTWQNSGETVLNQNPVPLDANGCAIIYGAGTYKMVVQDSLGNTVYTAITAATNGSNGIFWAAQAGGTGNAITVTNTNFALQDGYNLQFLALNANTGPTTITVSGGAAIPIVNDTPTGPAALSGGEIGPGNTPMLTYDAGSAEFHIVNPASAGSSSGSSVNLFPPQGYLNLVGQSSGDVIQTSDVTGVGTIFYSPFVGNTLPIWNGSTFKSVVFSELTATLTTAGSPSNTIQDECVFSNNGVPTLVTGPSWTTVTIGAGNRGTGAGSAQISRLQGIWVNAVSIIGYNGLSSYTIPANQCTYVGSVSVDATAGQTSAYVSFGQSRKWGVWNAYNRQPIQMQAGDGTSNWSYATNTTRAANGNAANSAVVFMGLPEEPVKATTIATISTVINQNQTTAGKTGVGYNSTTVFSGTAGNVLFTNQATTGITPTFTIAGSFQGAPALGLNTITILESGLGATATGWLGTQPNTVLTVNYRG